MIEIVNIHGGNPKAVECESKIWTQIDGVSYCVFLDIDGNIVESIPLQEICLC